MVAMTRVSLVCSLALLALLAALPVAVRAEGCQVSYFKAQAMAIHGTQERITMTHDWLKDNIPQCSAAQLKTILGNSPMWLGTALTPKIAGLLEAAIEAKSSDDASVVEQLLKPPTRKAEESLAEVQTAGPRGARNLTKPGAITSVDNGALMSQAAMVAAAAATAAAIVQGQAQPPGPPGSGPVKTRP